MTSSCTEFCPLGSGFKTEQFVPRRVHVIVKEEKKGDNGKVLVQKLPENLPFPRCIELCTQARDKLLMQSDCENYSIEIAMLDEKKQRCGHPGGDYVSGGGFAKDYKAALKKREQNMGKWLLQFFQQSDAAMRKHGINQNIDFQEFHETLEIMRRALDAWFLVKRKMMFQVPKGVPALVVDFNDMVAKALTLGQHKETEQYLKFCNQGGNLEQNLSFEIKWAAICEHAQLPHQSKVFVRKSWRGKFMKRVRENQKKQEKAKCKRKREDSRFVKSLLNGETCINQACEQLKADREKEEQSLKSCIKKQQLRTLAEPKFVHVRSPSTISASSSSLFGSGKAANGAGLPAWLRKKKR